MKNAVVPARVQQRIKEEAGAVFEDPGDILFNSPETFQVRQPSLG